MLRISQAYIDELLRGDWELHDPTTEGMGIGSVPARIVAAPKQDGIVAGVTIARRMFETVGLEVDQHVEDGTICKAGQPVMTVRGQAKALHCVYKAAQCVMEYSTGIARRTLVMVDAVKSVNSHARVAVTRKHIPGTKVMSINAVLAAGGIIHRCGLSDSVLVFDQHRDLADDPDAAIARLIAAEPERKIAVEVDNPEDGLHYAELGADIIQCERFTPEMLEPFVKQIHSLYPRVIVNAAGGVKGENAAAYAASGVDVLVTSWPYSAAPSDIKMRFTRE